MKPKIEYNGIEFDSEEEKLLFLFLEELQQNGFIDTFNYHPDLINLSNTVTYKWKQKLKTKEIEKETSLLREHIYTFDFEIKWNKKAKGIFYYNIDDKVKLDKIPFIAQNDITKVETKPSWDMQNMSRLWSINCKWVYQKYNIYVQKIIPTGKNTCLFARTFVPQKALLTKKTKQPKKFKYPVRTLLEFLNKDKV